MSGNNVTYFDSFGFEYVPKEIKKFSGNKNIVSNTYRIKAIDSLICGYFCIVFIDCKLDNKKMIDFTNSFSLKNLKIIKQYSNIFNNSKLEISAMTPCNSSKFHSDLSGSPV